MISGTSIHLKENGILRQKSKQRHAQEISVEGVIFFSDLILSPPSHSNTGVSLETFGGIIKGITTLWLWKRGVTKFFAVTGQVKVLTS